MVVTFLEVALSDDKCVSHLTWKRIDWFYLNAGAIEPVVILD